MSYYQFPGPVQGGFGPDDDEARRRRRHSQGGPYSGGVSSAPRPAPGMASAAEPQPIMPQYVTPSAPSAAPRQAAAVDMGSGPQQPSLMEAAQALDVEMAGAYDEPVKREPVERRAVRRPPGLETSYNQPVIPATGSDAGRRA